MARQATAKIRRTEQVVKEDTKKPVVTDGNNVAKLYQMRVRARHDIIWFCKEILQFKVLPGEKSIEEDPQRSWELDLGQIETLESVCDVVRKIDGVPTVINHEGKNQISAVSMHGSGKSMTVGATMHWFNFVFKGREIVTAPKEAQVTTRIWPQFSKIYYRAVPWYRQLMEISGKSIKWAPKQPGHEYHMAVAETAAKPENLAGHHEDYQLVLVEEATGVPEGLWPTIFGAMSTGIVQILLIISNPTKRTGTFADSHLKPTEAANWHRVHITLEKARRVSRQWIERLVRKYGEKSPVVRVRCYGLFPLDDPRQLIAYEWLDAARLLNNETDGSLPRRRITVDVMDGGDCKTVLTLAIHYQSKVVLFRQLSFSHEAGIAPKQAAVETIKMWNDWGLDSSNSDVVVDSIGVGAGTYSHLVGKVPVIRYVGGASSADPKRWRNRRVQSALVARDKFRESQIVFDPHFVEADEWDEVMGQLCLIKTRDTADRVEDIETKQQLMDDGNESPDRADSIFMQFATQAPTFVADAAKVNEMIVAPSVNSEFGNIP